MTVNQASSPRLITPLRLIVVAAVCAVVLWIVFRPVRPNASATAKKAVVQQSGRATSTSIPDVSGTWYGSTDVITISQTDNEFSFSMSSRSFPDSARITTRSVDVTGSVTPMTDGIHTAHLVGTSPSGVGIDLYTTGDQMAGNATAGDQVIQLVMNRR